MVLNTKESRMSDILADLETSFDGVDSEVLIDEITNLLSKLERKNRLEKKRKQEEQARKEAEEKEKKRIEHIESVTSMELPLDWENIFDNDKRTEGVLAESISDGLILSLTNLGKVDIEYISSITGEDYKSVICSLKGSIYQNPDKWNECFYQGWETAEEYLSGNVIRKWNSALAGQGGFCYNQTERRWQYEICGNGILCRWMLLVHHPHLPGAGGRGGCGQRLFRRRRRESHL